MIKVIDKNTAKLVASEGSRENRRRRTKIVSYSGKRDLERQYRIFLEEVRNSCSSDMTVSELIEAFIRNRRLIGVKPTTLHGYDIAANRIKKAIGLVLASKLTSYQLDKYVATLTEQYSPKTIANTISLLSSSYDYAIKTGSLDTNPCKNVTLPKRNKREIETLSMEEIEKLLAELNNEPLDVKVGYELALFLGLRRSEILALEEGDINVAFRCLTVSRSRHNIDGKDIIYDTKTKRSHRTLAVPGFILDDIVQLMDLHHNLAFAHTNYLIQDGFGQPLNPSTFSTHILLVEKNAGIKRVSLHGLRHTFATLLNAEGIDIAQISAELGHSNITTTLNIYTHVFGGTTSSSRNIANTIENLGFQKWGTHGAPEDIEKAANP